MLNKYELILELVRLVVDYARIECQNTSNGVRNFLILICWYKGYSYFPIFFLFLTKTKLWKSLDN